MPSAAVLDVPPKLGDVETTRMQLELTSLPERDSLPLFHISGSSLRWAIRTVYRVVDTRFRIAQWSAEQGLFHVAKPAEGALFLND